MQLEWKFELFSTQKQIEHESRLDFLLCYIFMKIFPILINRHLMLSNNDFSYFNVCFNSIKPHDFFQEISNEEMSQIIFYNSDRDDLLILANSGVGLHET